MDVFAVEGCDWRGVIPSPITGMDGNQEFQAWITVPEGGIKRDG